MSDLDLIHLYQILFATFAFVLGAVVGSFLNVCIYRMPLDLSVNEPRRSFCPRCKEQIPFSQNIPLISWIVLGGKCAKCKSPIAFRYFAVELLTALLFLAVWLQVPWILVLPYWILVGLLIVATFIDFDHFIIPDEITLGGLGAGLALSAAIPELMGTHSRLWSIIWSFVGAATGYLLLWGVVELGKLAFGKKRMAYEKPEPFEWKREGEDADVKLGDESMKWSDMFAREKDQLILVATEAAIDGRKLGDSRLVFHYNRVTADGEDIALDKINQIIAEVAEVIIPREAMGFGDVKFIACIGAFLGWKAVLFTVMSASVIGAAVGVAAIAVGRREMSAKIPFGPYLALGALIWMFFGWDIVHWYLEFVGGTS